VWFTGLPASGKSTLARALRDELLKAKPTEVLDGDEVREYLSKGLGYTREDRDTNVRRIGFVARALARNGAIAIGAAISPYAAARDEVRELSKRDGVGFVEVHLDCPLETLVKRDPKGLYQKALAGQLKHFTGVDDPYQPPETPELRLDTSRLSVEACVVRLREVLAARGLP